MAIPGRYKQRRHRGPPQGVAAVLMYSPYTRNYAEVYNGRIYRIKPTRGWSSFNARKDGYRSGQV